MMDGHHFENGYLYISAVKSSVYDEILYADVHCYAENGQPQKNQTFEKSKWLLVTIEY